MMLEFWHVNGQGRGRVAATAAEVDAELDRVVGLGDGVLSTVTLVGGAGVMYVGFRGEMGVAYYGRVGAGFYSQGEPRGGGPLGYDLQQHVTEFPPDAEVAAADVRAAVHEFAETGERPAAIRWQEWEAPVEDGQAIPAHDDPAWG
ncbi:Imm1 family immunity protein [Actinokineospora sp. NPDC004072]